MNFVNFNEFGMQEYFSVDVYVFCTDGILHTIQWAFSAQRNTSLQADSSCAWLGKKCLKSIAIFPSSRDWKMYEKESHTSNQKYITPTIGSLNYQSNRLSPGRSSVWGVPRGFRIEQVFRRNEPLLIGISSRFPPDRNQSSHEKSICDALRNSFNPRFHDDDDDE